ncbi:MAG: spore cortex biosynthesis protein YabQ [Clostridia bacterium]|nr:spore cortex biosynthesis protein YabQ [Clostridia bacterium]
MIVDSSHDICVFLWCLVCGFVIGAVFDLFRAFRKNVEVGKNMLAFQDALFCAFVFFSFTKTVELSNNGDLRWYEFIGAFLGIAMYFMWLSRVSLIIMTGFIGFCLKFVSSICCFFKRIFSAVLKPIYAVCRRAKALFNALFGSFRQKLIKKAPKNK